MQNAVSILRELWRARVAVAVFAVAAVMIGVLVAYQPSFPPKSRKVSFGTASVRILVDTPDSQVIAIAKDGAGDLGGHASLLAQLMAQGEAKAAIAKEAGLNPNRLITIAPADPGQVVPFPATSDPRAEVLITRTLTNDSGDQLPIIGVDAQAPDAGRAATLANAAVKGLEKYLGSKASVDGIPASRQLRVRGLSVAQGQNVLHGPGKVMAAAAAIFTFCSLCGLLLVGFAVARNWRAASAAEQRLGVGEQGWPSRPTLVPQDPRGTPPRAEAPAPAKRARGAATDVQAAPAVRSGRPAVVHWNDPPA